jgi:hypothetical protein
VLQRSCDAAACIVMKHFLMPIWLLTKINADDQLKERFLHVKQFLMFHFVVVVIYLYPIARLLHDLTALLILNESIRVFSVIVKSCKYISKGNTCRLYSVNKRSSSVF